MSHVPLAIDAELPPYAVALAETTANGRVAIYAGAGLSFAEPTGLPSGAILASRVHAKLLNAFPSLAGITTTDLVEISDAVEALPGGEDALRRAIVTVAEYTTADPTYGHRVLALLLLEGAVEVLTTNWDDCIERAYSGERVQAVVNEHDLISIVPPTVLKIHGCATQPNSLLLTSDHLGSPPPWVVDQTRARLGTSVVAFVGIGDVAGYVKTRLAEAIDDVGTIDNIRVVSPSIITKWDESQWSTVAPALAGTNRIAATADEFLDRLAAAYVYLHFATLREMFDEGSKLAAAVDSATDALSKYDPARVLAWVRHCGVITKAGVSILHEGNTATAIVALGLLTGGQLSVDHDSTLMTSIGRVEVLIASGTQPSSRLQREARNRLGSLLNLGHDAPIFLVAGGTGWSKSPGALPEDIVREGRTDDVLDGPSNSRPDIRRAEDVIAA